MTRVLVTGATGYIGRHMVDRLMARGYDVHGTSQRKRAPDPRITWHTVDLFNGAATEALCAEINATHLVHLAWETEARKFWESDKNKAWQSASEQLLSTFVHHGGKRAVLAGTCAEYDWSHGHCVAGVTPLRGLSAYARSKLAFRDTAFSLARKTGLSIAWARIFFSFGPHEQKLRLVPSIILALLAGERASCTDGEQLRDFMYAADVADAIAAVTDSDFEGDINIAQGDATTIRQLVQLICDKMAASDFIDFDALPRPANDPPRITADVSGLKSIGWAPHYTIDAAIDETITWWREQDA